ncbi:hypothetical protein KEU06_09540 [Pseudaminobacter sp. 19-2017]|uniref:Uncharacterized protein n=1 Tax=Pseudaminobacter soli (ex Zhang et al. 2022) TaxID=2831468 RepID=A0A942E0E3_9HYPH|nr:hypothetical protein [Pseudaminobacter soli]MBS3648848.1 hypothetical protein [Pseudaminobacter soli]
MTFTLSIDWWLLPLAASVAVWIWFFVATAGENMRGYGGDIVGLICGGLAVVITLTVWLLYCIYLMVSGSP